MPKLIAGPTPDGGFISRRTENSYSFAVAIIDRSERIWVRNWAKRADADEHGYVPNPTFGKYVSLSWHGRYDLAVKNAAKYRGAVVVPVVRPEETA